MPNEEEKPPSPEDVALGARIRRIRELRTSLTQLELAARIGRHVNSVQRYEAGLQKLRAIDIPPIAAALGVSCDALLVGNRVDPVVLALSSGDTTYFVHDEALRAIRAAKSIEDLHHLFDYGIEFGSQVDPRARRVSAEEYGNIAAEVRSLIAKLGGLPREWV